ncbi:hypothetical protein BGZ67_005881 [Mortierella alpina]|nr:hypothetical protein BGZ67_005881 [Mortierella alpina]
MSSLVPQGLSFSQLSKRDPPMHRSIRFHTLTGPSEERESELEDMMTDSAIACTPPLDLASDSGDDDDNDYDSLTDARLAAPLTPRSSFSQPVSILHYRKRKDSQEHGAMFDRRPRQHEAEPSADPGLDHHRNGAQGRRPTVSFDLDEAPSPPEPCLERTPKTSSVCHDDNEDDEDDGRDNFVDAVNSPTESDPLAATGSLPPANPDTQEQLLLTEQALRRVSIAPTTDGGRDEAIPTAGEQHGQQASAVAHVENSPPQETILDHILHECAPQDMLVALVDRPLEMQALVAMHSDFFGLVNSSLSKTARDRFKALLFLPRTDLSDREWMGAIVELLCSLPPCLLEKFKGIVGWIGPDGDEDEDENVLWGEDEYGCRDASFEQVQIKWLRDLEDFSLETFKRCYPQFIANARERLQGRRMSHGGDQRDQYLIFCETLQLSRKELPCDNAWTRRIMGCLEKHPELVLQLKEIVAYEVGYDV